MIFFSLWQAEIVVLLYHIGMKRKKRVLSALDNYDGLGKSKDTVIMWHNEASRLIYAC